MVCLGGVNAAEPPKITIQWEKILRVSRSNASLQVVVTPMMARESRLHDKVWQALHDLNAEYVRYVPWLPYPRLSVAELEPPANNESHWDFSLIDPFTLDFFHATAGHKVMLNFSTIPQWMFKTPKPVGYPSNPNHAIWDYTQGTELRDAGMKELADYYERLVSWYAKGGFTDEHGKWHESGHHFNWDYWEVLNEADIEHSMTPQQYTARYDAIVTAIRRVQPKMKFVGLALAGTDSPEFFEYFLNPKNHAHGIPLDMVSYHFYASLFPELGPESWERTVFDQTARFVAKVKYIENIRQRLAPRTETAINELGVIHPQDGMQGRPDYKFKPFPAFYWNLCAAQYALLYGELSKLGIEMVGQSALMQVPEFFPSVSMMDWETGRPNARYWVLKLLRENFGPGDKLVETVNAVPDVYAQAFLGRDGRKKVLLVNTRNRVAEVAVPGAAGGIQESVDQTTGYEPPAGTRLTADRVALRGLAVQVLRFQ